DIIGQDDTFGEASWEKAESAMQKQALTAALDKAKQSASTMDFLFGGDLLNQCIGTSFAARSQDIPFFGLYGACSTMAEGLVLASMTLDGGFGEWTAAVTSSHFCSAERQYRTPLEYGSQRTPTAQWTATAAGAVVLARTGDGPYITHATVGKIVDKGIKDPNNMGAAMAPAAYKTLTAHFADTGRAPDYYDLIVTGDLGKLGKEILLDLFQRDGIDLSEVYDDCGVLLFDLEGQDVHCGASGCGCSAAVLTGHLLNGMRAGTWKRILFCGTGALLSPTSSAQGESIPSICHAAAISAVKEG
ncbi:MAG: stage V sporulation protein AD, partial [Clostridiales bacterium]|nr:stage V sporulation protein AD [Clostridiales bacterium]